MLIKQGFDFEWQALTGTETSGNKVQTEASKVLCIWWEEGDGGSGVVNRVIATAGVIVRSQDWLLSAMVEESQDDHLSVTSTFLLSGNALKGRRIWLKSNPEYNAKSTINF